MHLSRLLSCNALQVAAHDAPVKHCIFVSSMNLLMTGGWDKNVRFWDCRSPTPVSSQTLSERIYAMDVNYPLGVVATADRNLHIYNLASPGAPFKVLQSQLKCQTRCVAVTSGAWLAAVWK